VTEAARSHLSNGEIQELEELLAGYEGIFAADSEDYNQDNVVQETRKGRTFGKRCRPKPECRNGIRCRDVKEPLHRRKGRNTANSITGQNRRQQLRLENTGNK
jgi:hypothetical protein